MWTSGKRNLLHAPAECLDPIQRFTLSSSGPPLPTQAHHRKSFMTYRTNTFGCHIWPIRLNCRSCQNKYVPLLATASSSPSVLSGQCGGLCSMITLELDGSTSQISLTRWSATSWMKVITWSGLLAILLQLCKTSSGEEERCRSPAALSSQKDKGYSYSSLGLHFGCDSAGPAQNQPRQQNKGSWQKKSFTSASTQGESWPQPPTRGQGEEILLETYWYEVPLP